MEEECFIPMKLVSHLQEINVSNTKTITEIVDMAITIKQMEEDSILLAVETQAMVHTLTMVDILVMVDTQTTIDIPIMADTVLVTDHIKAFQLLLYYHI